MNANLVTDLEVVRDKLASLETCAGSETVSYEIQQARNHVERAIEWEKEK